MREKEESDMVSKAPWYTGCANKGNEVSSEVSDLETDDKVCQLQESRSNSYVYSVDPHCSTFPVLRPL